jgi:pimeloyl-ACP methyl ester carboxylesterase
MRTKSEPPNALRRWLRMSLILGGAIMTPFLFIAACQSKLIYFPRPYPTSAVQSWQKSSQGEFIDFTTSQGKQRAFLQGNLRSPRNLWIVCGGNGSVALDWAGWLASHAPQEDAWLLVDFPGYGSCEGSPNPKHIRESFRVVIPIAAQAVGLTTKPDPSRLRVFGHSLGAAACLIAATEFNIRTGVLVSPFTSTMDMSREVTGMPLGFLVTHRFDNAARLDELIARGPTNITILHGTDDEVIPVEMARALTSGRESSVKLIEIQGALHNDIADAYPAYLARALRDLGQQE